MEFQTYVNYGGNCEEAFRFYERRLGRRVTMPMRTANSRADHGHALRAVRSVQQRRRRLHAHPEVHRRGRYVLVVPFNVPAAAADDRAADRTGGRVPRHGIGRRPHQPPRRTGADRPSALVMRARASSCRRRVSSPSRQWRRATACSSSRRRTRRAGSSATPPAIRCRAWRTRSRTRSSRKRSR